MKVIVLILALAAVALGDPVRVVEFPTIDAFLSQADEEQPSILGYIVDVSFPQAKARKEAEEAYFANAGRIAGGAPAAVGEFPWQAGLVSEIIGLDGNGVCGASLVSNNRLITAAHCWFDGINQAWRFSVVLGSVFLFGQDGIRLHTTEVIEHPSWTPALIRNDVAVIYLPSPVTFSATVAPVSLPSGAELNENFAGSTATASGFGLTADTGAGAQLTTNQFLSHVSVPVITNSACFWTFPIVLASANICISGEGGRSTCSGDSGGPLIVYRAGKPVLIGITSFGLASGCTNSRPAAFARVTSFMDFFNQHV